MTTEQQDPDALWAEQVERAINRPPAEVHLTQPDLETSKVLLAANQRLLDVQRRVAREIIEEHDRGGASEPPTDDEVAEARDAHPDVVQAQAAYDDAEADAARKELPFHLRAMQPHQYDALRLQHPPTDEQVALGQMYNPETFFPALLAASSVKPLTAAQAAGLLGSGNYGDLGVLIATCRSLNEKSAISLGKG